MDCELDTLLVFFIWSMDEESGCHIWSFFFFNLLLLSLKEDGSPIIVLFVCLYCEVSSFKLVMNIVQELGTIYFLESTKFLMGVFGKGLP